MKTFKTINIIFIISMILINFFYIIKNTMDANFSTLIANGLLFLSLSVPLLVKKILKINLSELFKFLYFIYIIITVLIGEVMKLIEDTLWFDKIVHCYFGFLITLVAGIILIKNNRNSHEKTFFNILFLVGFALLITNCWEYFEYIIDRIFHTNHQRYKQTGLNDTMLDLIVAFLGSIIIIINYYIESKRKKMGLFFYSIREEKINSH